MRKDGQVSLLVGIHSVEAALDSAPGQLQCLVLAAESRNQRARALAERAREQGIRVLSEPRAALDRRSGGERHQDIVAERSRDRNFAIVLTERHTLHLFS